MHFDFAPPPPNAHLRLKLRATVVRTAALVITSGGVGLALLSWLLQPYMPQLSLGLAAWALGGAAVGLMLAMVRGPTELIFEHAPGRMVVLEPGAAPLPVPFADIVAVCVLGDGPVPEPTPSYRVVLRMVDGGVWVVRDWSGRSERAEAMAERLRAALEVESAAPEPRRPSSRVRERKDRLETLNHTRPTLALSIFVIAVFFALFATSFGDGIPALALWGVLGFVGLVMVTIVSSAVPRWLPVQTPFDPDRVGTVAVDLEPGSGPSLRFARVDCPHELRPDNLLAARMATRVMTLVPLRLGEVMEVAERLRARLPNLGSVPAAPPP